MKNHSASLGTEKISKLLLKQSLPAIIGMLVMSLYNITDTIFIGKGVGSLGIAGLAIALPIQMLIMAFIQAIGIGAASLISRSLGANKITDAKLALGNFFLLQISVSIIITALGMIFITPILNLFGATDSIFPYAYDYMSIILYGTVFIAFAAGSNNIIRSEGNAKLAMLTMIVSVVVNIILDPIFIFVLDMGMKGAALATVIAQVCSAIYVFYYFISKKSTITFEKEYTKFNLPIVKEIFAIGSSSLGRIGSATLMAIILNNSLSHYGGDLAIASFGIINRFIMLVMMPIFGIIQGLQPILGFNYGAKQYSRAKESIYLSIKISTIMATGAFFVLFFATTPIVNIFTNDAKLIEITVRALKIIVILMPTIGFQIVASGMYQSLGDGKKAFFIGILRQIIILVPLVVILPYFFDFDGLLYAFPVTDFLAGFITFFIVKKDIKLIGQDITNKK